MEPIKKDKYLCPEVAVFEVKSEGMICGLDSAGTFNPGGDPLNS